MILPFSSGAMVKICTLVYRESNPTCWAGPFPSLARDGNRGVLNSFALTTHKKSPELSMGSFLYKLSCVIMIHLLTSSLIRDSGLSKRTTVWLRAQCPQLLLEVRFLLDIAYKFGGNDHSKYAVNWRLDAITAEFQTRSNRNMEIKRRKNSWLFDWLSVTDRLIDIFDQTPALTN